MTPDLLERAEREFHRLAALPEAERTAALRSLADGDRELAALVGQLLDSDGDAMFMREPAHDLARMAWRGPSKEAMPIRIGRYEIISVLGEGGMGLVYEARQDVPRRHVALKVMRDGLVTPETLSRFRREAELLGSLRHPGIASVYDAGWAQPEFTDGPGHEQPFLAMELIRGSGFLKAADRLDRPGKLELFARVCDAVGFAHACGIVHRDLKPSNVLVDESGAPKVLDFGVARVTEGSQVADASLRTEAGRVIGTLGYISPEQHDGGNAGRPAIDQRADVYALGVMLCETLTGRTPHDLRNRSIADAARIVRDEEPTGPGMMDRSLRGDLDTIVRKAIDRDPRRRYATAAELASDVRRFLRHETISARPASAMYRLRKFTRRHRVLVAATSAVFLALTAGLAVSILFAVRETGARRDMDVQRQRAENEAYRANIAAAQAAMLADDGAMARSHLDRTDPALRGWEYHHVRHGLETWISRGPLLAGSPATVISPPDGGPLVTFDGAGTVTLFSGDAIGRTVRVPRGIRIGGVDADRKLIAFLNDASRAECLELLPEAAQATPRWLLPNASGKWAPGISPDGRFLATVEADETQVAIYDTATGAEVRRLNVRASFPPPAFTPDGRTLVVSRLESSVTAIDLPSGSVLWEKPAGFQSFSIDGSQAALTTTAEGRSWALVVDVRTGVERGRVPIGGSLAWGAARAVLRPDGGVLAVVDTQGILALWDTRTWQRLAKLYTPSPIQSLRYDGPDLSRLSAATRGDERIAWPAAVATAVSAVPAMQTAPTATAISPSGERAAIVDWGSISVWDTRTLRPLWRRSIEPRNVRRCEFLTDEHVIAETASKAELIFDAATGEQVARADQPPLATRRESTASPRIESDGTVALNVGPRERIFRGTAPVLAVCASPSGTRLAGVCRDGSITVWDVESGEAAAHLRLAWINAPSGTDPEAQARYAVSVSFRGAEESRAALVIASYSGLTIFESDLPERALLEARDRAVRAHTLVDPLLRRHHSTAEAKAALLQDTSVAAALRDEALSLLETLGDHAATLNSQAWSRVASTNRTPAEAAKGLELSTRAAELLPTSPLVLNTLAVAQWRTGDAPGALATIRRIERLSAKPGEPLTVIDLAIATLASQRLADVESPRWRARLRTALEGLDPSKDPESAAFAREAGEEVR